MTDTNITNENNELLALKNEYEAIIAKKDAENALLKNQISEKEQKSAAELAAAEAYLNEYVDVKLFRDGDRYADDVYVAVNGQNCVIKRGEWVKIKRKFAMVLDASEIQDMKADALMHGEGIA